MPSSSLERFVWSERERDKTVNDAFVVLIASPNALAMTDLRGEIVQDGHLMSFQHQTIHQMTA